MTLRVLHASPTWFAPDSVVGGGERWVDNVMLALDAGAPNIEQGMVAIGDEAGELHRRRIPVRILANERSSPNRMQALSSELWKVFADFDVIHVHQALTDFGAYACCVAATLGKTLIATDLGGGDNPVMLAGGLAMADGIVSISRYAHRMIATLSSAPYIVLIGPIDTDRFAPPPAPSPKPAALCVGRILPHKGIDRLIRALPVGLKLRVVGKIYHEPYRALLGELAEGKDVEFIHDVDDETLIDLYHRSTLFLQASCIRDVYGSIAPKTELMGLTTLEAMACGLAVAVSADGGSLPELVTDPRFGFVFADERALVEVLDRHLAGLWPSGGAAEAARTHVVAECSLAAYGRRLGEFYTGIQARRRSSKTCAS